MGPDIRQRQRVFSSAAGSESSDCMSKRQSDWQECTPPEEDFQSVYQNPLRTLSWNIISGIAGREAHGIELVEDSECHVIGV